MWIDQLKMKCIVLYKYSFLSVGEVRDCAVSKVSYIADELFIIGHSVWYVLFIGICGMLGDIGWIRNSIIFLL